MNWPLLPVFSVRCGGGVAPRTGRADRNSSRAARLRVHPCRAPHGARGSKPRASGRGRRPGGRAPHGARGSKHREITNRDVICPSRPARGARIETRMIQSQNASDPRRAPHGARGSKPRPPITRSASDRRAPHGARGSKQSSAAAGSGANVVAPRTGRADRNAFHPHDFGRRVSRAPHGARGSKPLLIRSIRRTKARRAPHGARGSKPEDVARPEHPMVSRPARGARIETCDGIGQLVFESSRPARGARIETRAAGGGATTSGVAPRTGRADRNTHRERAIHRACNVAPRTGRADRNALARSGSPSVPVVAPRTGRADRNLILSRVMHPMDLSRPARGARIETPSRHRRRSRLSSRPARGARIETAGPSGSGSIAGVAPRTGRADRNRRVRAFRLSFVASRPARGARIETSNKSPVSERVACRAPHGARGSKLLELIGRHGPQRRAPPGARGSKHREITNRDVICPVAPRTGRADRNLGAFAVRGPVNSPPKAGSNRHLRPIEFAT